MNEWEDKQQRRWERAFGFTGLEDLVTDDEKKRLAKAIYACHQSEQSGDIRKAVIQSAHMQDIFSDIERRLNEQAHSVISSIAARKNRPRGDDTERNRVIRLMRDARAHGQNLRAFLENAVKREFWDDNGLRIDPIEGNGLPSRAARYMVVVDRGGEEEETPRAFEALKDWWKEAGKNLG